MSRKSNSWVVLALLTMLLTVVTLLGDTSAASAANDPIIPAAPPCVVTLVSGDPATAPVAPTCYDPSGADEDEFLVPVTYSQDGYDVSYVDQNDNPYYTDRPSSTMGASQVPIQSMQYDPAQQMYMPGHAWVLNFDTSVTGTPSTNSYWLSVGDCVDHPGLPVRQVTAYVRNEPGADGRYIGSVYPESYANGADVAGTVPVSRVFDGSTASIPLVTDEYDPGLFAGYTYTVKFWLSDTGAAWDDQVDRTLGQTLSVYVPSCDGTQPPPPPPPGTVVPPQATITVVHWTRRFRDVRVELGSLRAIKPTRYHVVINPRRGRTVRRTFLTEHQVLSYHVRRRTLVKVYFASRVVRRRV